MELVHSSYVLCVVMMDDGRIVISIIYNLLIFIDTMLLIYNIDGSHEDSIPLEYESCGVTAIDHSTVAVTSYNTINMYDINNKVKLKSIVIPDNYFIFGLCRMSSITTINNKLVVSVYNSILIIDHQTCEVVKTIHTDGISTWCLHGTSDKIFYCDDYFNNNNNNIYCYNYSNDQVDIKKLPSPPNSITSLQDGSVYVTCMNGSVQHVSSDGKSYKTVTTGGLLSMEKPFVISYNPKQRKLVTCRLRGIVKVFDEV